MLRHSGVRLVWLAACATGILLAVLSAGLPADGYFAGDSGVKLIAAFNAIDHPARPFEIALPRIAGQPVPYVERFFVVHGWHAHVLQSPFFPVISAPLIAAFGLRGAYVLPTLCFLALIPAVFAIGRRAAPAASTGMLLCMAILSNPLAFYAFEFWEHVPAAACLAGGILLAVGRRESPAAPAAVSLGGALAAAAALLRPEAFWGAVAVGAVAVHRRRGIPYLYGAALPLAAYATANYFEAGTLLGPHVAANLAVVPDQWLSSRLHRAWVWLAPQEPLHWVGLAVVAGGWLVSSIGVEVRRAQAIALAGITVTAAASALGSGARESLWHAWPVGFLLLVPGLWARASRELWWLAGFTTVAIWLSSTNDGGAQWGPRYLLVSAPLLMALAAAAASDAAGPGWGRPGRRLLIAAVIACGLWTTRAAYKEVRGAKQYYSRLTAQAANVAAPGAHVIFNAWWFDQVVAPLYRDRTFLFADSTSRATAILNALGAAGVKDAVLAWSRESAEGGSLEPSLRSSCFSIDSIIDIPEREMTFARVRCDP
jgi:hypothetical protein